MNDRSGRPAAWGALIAVAVFVLVVADLLIRDLRLVLFVLAALAVAGAGGWLALTRHNAARLAGMAVATLAIGAVAIALYTRGAFGELAMLVVAFIAFGMLSRVAFQHANGAHKPVSDGPGHPRVAPRRRALLLMNPRSGDGKPERFHLVDEARRRGIEPILLSPGEDWREIAREAARRADVIGMAGGDGSQALVSQIASELDVPYVCIPAGTRNHLALDLGLDRDDVVGALDAFFSDAERCIDLAFVNGRVFVNNVSLGIYAEIVQSDAYRGAKLETMEQMLPDLLGPRATPFDLQYRDGDGRAHTTAQLILVSNNPYRLDRLGGMGSRPRLDTGMLGIMTLTIDNAAQAAELLSLESLGQVHRFQGWLEWAEPQFQIRSGGPVAAGIDGEGVKLDPPLCFSIVPGALHVLLPPRAAGLSPAALRPTLSSSGLSGLWRIASGRP